MEDPLVIDRLIEIMKASPPNLQQRAASMLEYATVVDTSISRILSSDIESGLEAMFKQKVVSGMVNNNTWLVCYLFNNKIFPVRQDKKTPIN